MVHSELWFCSEQNLDVQVLFKSLAGQCIKCRYHNFLPTKIGGAAPAASSLYAKNDGKSFFALSCKLGSACMGSLKYREPLKNAFQVV